MTYLPFKADNTQNDNLSSFSLPEHLIDDEGRCASTVDPDIAATSGRALGRVIAWFPVGQELEVSAYEEGEKLDVDPEEILDISTQRSSPRIPLIAFASLFGKFRNFVTDRVSAPECHLAPVLRRPWQRESIPLLMMEEPSDHAHLIDPAAIASMGSVPGNLARIEVPAKGRGYIQRGEISFRPRNSDPATRIFTQCDTKGTGLAGWAAANRGALFINHGGPLFELGACKLSGFVGDIQGEALAVSAGLATPRVVALCEWKDFPQQIIGKAPWYVNEANDHKKERYFALSRGWENGHRIFELIYTPYAFLGGLPLGQSILSFSLPLQSLFSLERRHEIHEHALRIVNEYLDTGLRIRTGNPLQTGLGAVYQMDLETLSRPGRIPAYMDSFRKRLLQNLCRAASASLQLGPIAFHTENIAISGETSGFDRIFAPTEDIPLVRAGIASAFIDIFGAYNILATTLGMKPVSFAGLFDEFQHELHAVCSGKSLAHFAAASFEELIDKGLHPFEETPGNSVFPFSNRFEGDCRILIGTLERWFNIQQEIFSGELSSDKELKDLLCDDLPQLLFDPLAQYRGGFHKYSSAHLCRDVEAHAIAFNNLFSRCGTFGEPDWVELSNWDSIW